MSLPRLHVGRVGEGDLGDWREDGRALGLPGHCRYPAVMNLNAFVTI